MNALSSFSVGGHADRASYYRNSSHAHVTLRRPSKRHSAAAAAAAAAAAQAAMAADAYACCPAPPGSGRSAGDDLLMEGKENRTDVPSHRLL